MKYLLSLFFIVIAHLALSQHIVRGTIVDAESNEVVAGATVYINNSTIRTSTDKDGEYVLKLPGDGNYELVVSAIGYELSVHEIRGGNDTKQVIKLRRKNLEIEEVAVSPFLKDGWKQWGKYFTDTFIGTTAFAKQTKILNPEVLRFRYDNTHKVLTVFASQPIKISNPDLGYHIDYDLHAYSMDFNAKYLYFEGFASFQNMKRVSRKVLKNREEAYRSSLMRFVRSTYRNSWDQDGYVVRELIRVVNQDRVRADSLMKVIHRQVVVDFHGSWTSYYASQHKFNEDSVRNLRQVLRQPAVYSMLGRKLIENQILADSEEQGLKKVSYDNYLYIQNPQIDQEDSYFVWNMDADGSSQLKLLPESFIWIDTLGNFSPPPNWVLEGYWAWYNKLATMLPLDYSLD